MVKKRKGFKVIGEFPEGEKAVAMVTHNNRIYVATERSVYFINKDDQLEQIGFKVVDK